MSKDLVIRAHQLSKCYNIYSQPRDRLLQSLQPLWRGKRHFARKFWALSDISFELRRGECLGILGRNGAGKSTLLQIVAKTLEPTSGSIEVNGVVAALLELGSGFNPEFTGRENVFLNASILGLRNQEIEQKFDEITAFAEIGDFIDQPLKTYSSGMMMRLAFAVQTAVSPDILIVDEALSVGDAKFQKKCFDRMERLRQNGGTILFVTHDSGTVVQICDRAIILEDGKLFQTGSPQSVVRAYHRLLFDATGQPNRQEAANSDSDHLEKRPSALKPAPESVESGAAPAEIAPMPEVRYGSKAAEILEIGIRPSDGTRNTLMLEPHDMYDAYFVVRYNQAILNPFVFGFIVSNSKGLEIYATKSSLHALYLQPGTPGEKYECTMRIPAMLVPGVYFLTVAIAPTEDDDTKESEFFDMRFDALQFQVIGSVRCHKTCMVDLNADLGYQRLLS